MTDFSAPLKRISKIRTAQLNRAGPSPDQKFIRFNVYAQAATAAKH